MQDISRTLMHNQMQLKLADIVNRFEMALLPKGELQCCVGVYADAFVYSSVSEALRVDRQNELAPNLLASLFIM